MTEQTIFLAALDITDPAGRRAYLDSACAGDDALRRQVEALLAAHERPGEFLDVPAVEQIAAGRSQAEKGTVALEVNAEGEGVGAGRDDPSPTRAEPQGHDEEEGLQFLQPSARPGSLGRMGHYEVQAVLGRGGFGIVLKAFDDLLHRVVAIKVMAPHRAATSPARKRFLREARAAAAIRHENVVDIHAVDEQPIPYLVMEHVAGQTLQQKLDRVGPLDVPEVLRLGRQIAASLAAAHALGLIHRDIKPSNILLEAGALERVKITDFGLARAADDASLTQSGVIAGTPLYMAPEQAQGEAIDHRADLFSLGSVLYVMCTGRPPFRASTPLAVLKRVAEDTPRPIREIMPEVPNWLCAIIARSHAKKPEDRFGSAQEVADLLARCLLERQAHGSVPPPADVTRPATGPAPAAGEPARSAGSRAGQAPTSRSAPAPADPRNGKYRPPWHVPLIVGTAAVPVLAGLLLALASRPWRREPPADLRAPIVFRVEANQAWQDTGVDVVEGETVVLAPGGEWRKDQQTCSAGGLEQAPRERAVLPGPPLLCLLVRIGDEPAPTPVRQREVWKLKRSGRLFAQANDLDLEDNHDGLHLTIRGGLRLGDAAPPAGLLPAQAADRDWKPFLARVEAPGVKPEEVREQVVAYCQKYPGTRYARQAAPYGVRAARRLQQQLNLPPLVNSLGMKLAPIPPGQFLMGSPDDEPGRDVSESPRHAVVITKPFYLGVHDVTVGQFKAFVQADGYRTEAEEGHGAYRFFPDGRFDLDSAANWKNPGFEQTDDHLVVCVNWNDARAFCDWLSAQEGKSYTLPTEAQWEYACRAGSQARFYFGDDERDLVQHAWYKANANWNAHPVGGRKPNAWGLYDMLGNVWQWTADRYAADYYQKSPREDPPGPGTGGTRVVRGGTRHEGAERCRAAQRLYNAPTFRDTYRGFRVALLP
jgi:formylglycine-generating enzyme required for sulfatase activity/serine/threonine protein kinase